MVGSPASASRALASNASRFVAIAVSLPRVALGLLVRVALRADVGMHQPLVLDRAMNGVQQSGLEGGRHRLAVLPGAPVGFLGGIDRLGHRPAGQIAHHDAVAARAVRGLVDRAPLHAIDQHAAALTG